MAAPRNGRLIASPGKVGALLLLTVALLGLAGCSPESGRLRGGGAGADVGNRDRPEDVQLQGEVERDARIYDGTPRKPEGIAE